MDCFGLIIEFREYICDAVRRGGWNVSIAAFEDFGIVFCSERWLRTG